MKVLNSCPAPQQGSGRRILNTWIMKQNKTKSRSKRHPQRVKENEGEEGGEDAEEEEEGGEEGAEEEEEVGEDHPLPLRLHRSLQKVS